MWGFLTSLIHGGDDDVTLRAAHENVPIDVRIQSTLNSVELVVEFSAVTLFCVLCPIHVVTFTLISNLARDYIQKRRGQALHFSFEYNLLPNLISE